jgi:hypothetical protein
MKFTGYHTITRWSKVKLKEASPDTLIHFDLRHIARNLERYEGINYEPLCPLAACNMTLNLFEDDIDTRKYARKWFENGQIVIDVIDVTRQTVETYDIKKWQAEMWLEDIAG